MEFYVLQRVFYFTFHLNLRIFLFYNFEEILRYVLEVVDIIVIAFLHLSLALVLCFVVE